MGNEKVFSSPALGHFNIYIPSPGSDNSNCFYVVKNQKEEKKFNTMTFKLEVLGKGYKLSLLITFK